MRFNVVRFMVFAFSLGILTGCIKDTDTSAQDARFIYKHVSELPEWRGNPETISWVNPQSSEKRIGIIPDLKWNANKVNLIKFNKQMTDENIQPLKFSYDWTFTSQGNGCLETRVQMKNLVMRGDDSYFIKTYRRASPLKKYLACFLDIPSVSYAVETKKYIALLTSEPSWIFYNKETYKFAPLIVGINTDMASNLYIDSLGNFFIDIERTETDPKGVGAGEHRAKGIRSIKL